MISNFTTMPHIEPASKEALSSKGSSIVDDPSKENLLIAMKSDSCEGGDFQGFHTAYVDAQISVTDLSNGEEMYKMSYDNTKAVSNSYEDAAMKAYD